MPADGPFLGIWLHAPLSELEQRITARTNDASDASVAVLHKAAHSDPGPGDWLSVDATDATKAQQVVQQAIAGLLH